MNTVEELQAHIERLREALIECHNAHDDYYIGQEIICKVIIETPAQSLSEVKARAIEEAVEEVKDSWSKIDIEDIREYIKKLRGE